MLVLLIALYVLTKLNAQHAKEDLDITLLIRNAKLALLLIVLHAMLQLILAVFVKQDIHG